VGGEGKMNSINRPLPAQDADKVLLHAQRWRRAADALQKWSETARKCVDYFEGRQWSDADLRFLAQQKRPALTLNKIRPLVNLVLGYFLNQRTDIKFLPGFDGVGTAELAQVLSHIERQIAEMCQLGFVDAEVYLDGLLTGRGYFDTRLDFQKNDLGDVCSRAADNFAVYIDPDLDDYDLNRGSFIMRSKWVSLDEVEFFYGMGAVERLGPFLQSGGVASGMPTGIAGYQIENSPPRRFALEEDAELSSVYSDYFYDFIDTSRRNVRLLDIEHYVRVKRWFFVDLETGSSKPVPDNWDQARVDKALAWAKENGQPVVVQQRFDRRLRCTHMIGDVIVYDRWSKYDSMTLTGFFPYFRRGMTQGMVEHLLDAQDEVNKRRSARLNIVGRSANGGWAYPKGALDAQGKANLERFGSTPGFQLEYDTRNGTLPPPQQIQPAVTPVAMSQLEQEAEDDLKKISGINDSALGVIDQAVMSGAAIERRQRQTIVGLEHYVAHFKRTKELLGRKHLELIQNFYTERRVIRATGQGNTQVAMIINERTAAGIINDVTLGSYAVAVDETPMSRSFMEAQFEELLALKQMGMPIPDDFLIDASSMNRKQELKASLAAARAAQAQMGHNGGPPMDGEDGEPGNPARPQGRGPGGSRVGLDGGSLPNGPEPGAPVPMAQ
jgi:hypothetical protein